MDLIKIYLMMPFSPMIYVWNKLCKKKKKKKKKLKKWDISNKLYFLSFYILNYFILEFIFNFINNKLLFNRKVYFLLKNLIKNKILMNNHNNYRDD